MCVACDLGHPEACANQAPPPMHCGRCGRFVGEDALEGIDWSAGTQMDGDVAWTGIYYCAPNVGCNTSLND